MGEARLGDLVAEGPRPAAGHPVLGLCSSPLSPQPTPAGENQCEQGPDRTHACPWRSVGGG